MIRSNHYEAAFEAYLRDRGLGYVAVDEAKRTVLGEKDVKNVDFIVVGPESAKLVVDVKGRKFPSGTSLASWQNWTEAEDIDGLDRWASHFGAGFRGLLAFVYEIQPPYILADTTPDYFGFRHRHYLVRGIAVAEYRRHMRQRSPKWNTVHLPAAEFRKIVKPFSAFLKPDSLR